ncbi:MAG: hypothetical protein AAFV93_13290, partial [Chloroflexota bacterium]
MHRTLIVAIFVLITAVLSTNADELYTISRDIPYIENGHERQVLDIYLPTTTFDAPYPVMILVHGGGFFFGDNDSIENIAQRYA